MKGKRASQLPHLWLFIALACSWLGLIAHSSLASPLDAVCTELLQQGFEIEPSYRTVKQFDEGNGLPEFSVRDETGHWDNALCGPTSLYNSLPKILERSRMPQSDKAAMLTKDLRAFLYSEILRDEGPRQRERLKNDGLEPQDVIGIAKELLRRDDGVRYLSAIGNSMAATDFLARFSPLASAVVLGHIAFHQRQADGSFKRLYGHYNVLAGRRGDQYVFLETYHSNRYGPYQTFRLEKSNPVGNDRPAIRLQPAPEAADVVTLEGLLVID